MPPTPAPAVASVDVGTVRQRFNFDWAMSDPVDGVDTYWWWARSVRVDPGEVIADDDNGSLWSVPFTTDGADEVTFGTPVRVRETFVPVGQGDGVTASAVVARRGQRVAASGLDRPAKPKPHTSASSTIEGQEARMTEEQLARIGLPADATDDQIDARIDALAALEDPTPDPAVVTDPPITEPTAAREPVAASGLVSVDAATLEQLHADASAGREAREQQRAEDRDRVIGAAVAEGRIAPARREHYRTLWASDADGTRTLLTAAPDAGGLAPGLIPLSELGHAGGADASSADAEYDRVLAARGLKPARQ